MLFKYILLNSESKYLYFICLLISKLTIIIFMYYFYRNGEKTMIENLELDDCKEGLRSFVEKRKPNWSN